MMTRTRSSGALLLVCLLAQMSAGEEILNGGGDPKGGLMPPVLFRSTQCATADGKVCSGNGLCGTEYFTWGAEDIVSCKCYEGCVLFFERCWEDARTSPVLAPTSAIHAASYLLGCSLPLSCLLLLLTRQVHRRGLLDPCVPGGGGVGGPPVRQ